MRSEPRCPRCNADLHAPSIWSSEWTCDVHGAVAPLQPVVAPSPELAHSVADSSAVPVWVPWPLPRGWLLTGIATAGDDRTGARAVAVACSGPAPLGGVGELVLVAEEPGVGLGARYAGIAGPDPGTVPAGPADAKVTAAGHPTAVWELPAPTDRAVYVGESHGCWIYLIVWPETAGFLLIDEFALTDLRDAGQVDLPCGAPSPRLHDPH